MSKNKEALKSEQQQTEQPANGNTIADDLLKNGQTILTAKTREELFAKFNELKASDKDVPLSTGAVGRKDDGNFILQVNIVKP
jgi:hypothetical protein